MSSWSAFAFVALGANLGEPQAQLEAVIAELQGWVAPGSARCSSLWRSEPFECDDGTPDFINGVVALPLDALGTARDLLARLQTLEGEQGRPQQRVRNTPRTLDLDIITFGELVVAETDLTIPHPRATERRFVLAPLCEIDAQIVLPGQTRTVSDLLACAPPLVMERLGPPS